MTVAADGGRAVARQLHLRVEGRVQGVGFRWFVQERATALALAGWVRNRGDGAVEVAAEGSAAALAALESALREGPPHASVGALIVLPPVAEPLTAPFRVRRDG
jgi:acylphosphatase